MISAVERLTWVLGVTLAMGAVLVPLGCGGSGEAGYDPASPTHRGAAEVPERVMAQLTDCVKQTAASLPPAEGNTYTILFDVQASESGRVGAVKVKDSMPMLGGHAVEACMARILEGSTLPVRATAMGLAPEARALMGMPAGAVPWGAVPKPIPLPPVVIVVGAVVVAVVILVYVISEASDEDRETERCKKVKRECIEYCSDTTLPTPDFGWKFQKCKNDCLERSRCPRDS